MWFSVYLLLCTNECYLQYVCMRKYTYVVHPRGYVHAADWLQYLYKSGCAS